jgi:cyclophilin family peptidyl-prolyl cis-trans isomerase
VTTKLAGAAAAAHALCTDPNGTIRERATKALRTLGDPAATCPAPKGMPVAKEADLPRTQAKLTFDFETGKLVVTLDGELAPVASQRFLALAKAGFYKGIVAHRVVPGFVVQFGDPQGDGFGGGGQLLRCETSPVPFGPLDVGVALAGRDTGSSQLFVTLGRFPHLDGDYARVGHASGDPWAIAEGDSIREVTVEE